MTDNVVPVRSIAPMQKRITSYDRAHLVLYVRLLDADADSADWREVSRVMLDRDAATEPDEAYRCWVTHLQRAKWVAERCHDRLMK